MHGRPRRLLIHLIDSFDDERREGAHVLHHKLHTNGGGDLMNGMSTERWYRNMTIRTPNSSTVRSKFTSSLLISASSFETRSAFLPLVRMSLLTESSLPVEIGSRRRFSVVDLISWSALLGRVRRMSGFDAIEDAPEQPLHVALHLFQLFCTGFGYRVRDSRQQLNRTIGQLLVRLAVFFHLLR
jgi:hypothetical protein